MYTNINITNNEFKFKYIVEYNQQNINSSAKFDNIYYRKDKNTINFYTSNNKYERIGNIWKKIEDRYDEQGHIIPDSKLEEKVNNYSISNIKLYFPQFSVDTYSKGIKYALTLNTWINGVAIYLGTYILDRNDTLACSPIKVFDNEKYYEYIDLDIINPYEMMYGDNWINFRNEICGEIKENNATGSILNAVLYPIISYNDYYIMTEYTGSQNSINLGTEYNNTDYMKLNISSNFNNETPGIDFKLLFNKVYNNDLNTYIKETYNHDIEKLVYEITIIDNDSIYLGYEENGNFKLINHSVTNLKDTDYTFSKEEIVYPAKDKPTLSDINKIFNNWDYWHEGMNFIGYANIYLKNIDKQIEIRSNKIPLTQELFKFFVKDKNNIIYDKLDLSKIDMEVKQINAVNKIINKVIKVDKPQDSKSNIIMPVFFRAAELNKITIHPEVTENICINLDPYKSKVDTFILQIEGKQFKEIGSNYKGVIFKVNGHMLPNKVQSGTYYVLNENYDVITSGKYKYEQ